MNHRFAIAAALTAFGLHVLHALGVGLGPWYADVVAPWFLAAVFFGTGLACLRRAWAAPVERRPWALIGLGLVLYGTGSVVYNVELAADPALAFPSHADALWLLFYPLGFAGMIALVRARHVHVSASLWLDGLIGGSVVAAAAAVFVLRPVLDLESGDGWVSIARFAYPVFDLALTGFAVVIWGAGRWRLDAWLALAVGFALTAFGDSLYLLAQAGSGWAPGSLVDLGYATGAVMIAAGAWRSHGSAGDGSRASRVGLPIAFTAASFGLVSYEAFVELDPLTVALIRLTLLAVVVRLGFTLWWLSRQRADLEALAASDPLTGLGNYRAFQEQLERAVAEPDAAVSVVVLDLDHFKALNDTYGHAEGDRVLQATATTLARTVGETGFVARVGGEEFAIVAHRTDAGAATALAERCRGALARLDVPGQPLACSAGVAAYPSHARTVAQLLQCADGALYWAKRSGRNRVRLFDPRHVVALSLHEQRREVEALLASERAITPVFQPIMEVATGRAAGHEALARFAPPFERPPDLWFAQAHRCGLGAAMEAQAVRAALAVAGRPAGAFLALNVSPAALLSPEVQASLPRDLTDIVIELTEHEAFDQDGALEPVLSSLRLRGARIALDDAGAGYAGLQQLIRIRPDIVKVDRSLVAGVHRDPSKLALLEALARFASTTGAAVCAEGIEELPELHALAGFDVTYAQGYALARPGPGWPSIPLHIAAHAASVPGHGMRLAEAAGEGSPASLGELTDVLARVGTLEELKRALASGVALLGGEEVALSAVDRATGSVQTLSDHDWGAPAGLYPLADYPTTAHVVERQVVGQVIGGDPASDPAELRVLEEAGMGASLLVPLVLGRDTIALLEIYRRAPQAWTNTQIDHARVLANHVAATLDRVTRPARAWRPLPAGGAVRAG